MRTARLTISMCLLLTLGAGASCRRSYDAEFDVFSAQTGAGIGEAGVELRFGRHDAPGRPRDRTLATDPSGGASTRIGPWPFMVVSVNEPGFDPFRATSLRPRFAVPGPPGSQRITTLPPPVTPPATAPSSFEVRRVPGERRREFDLGLEWDERPTVIVRVPDRFRGVVVLERSAEPPELPEMPEPRVFESSVSAGGLAVVPDWARDLAPYVHYRFFTASGREIPRYQPDLEGPTSTLLRHQPDSIVAFIGSEDQEAHVRRVLFVTDLLEMRCLVREPAFEATKAIVREAEDPVTPEELEEALGLGEVIGVWADS